MTVLHPLGPSLGRWSGLFFCTAAFCLVTRTAAAADPRVLTIVETRTPIALDGSLDEEVWRTAEAATDFVQAEPHEGQPATERTDVRLLYDRDALYVGVRCYDATPSALHLRSPATKRASDGKPVFAKHSLRSWLRLGKP